jgi:putative redox protein
MTTRHIARATGSTSTSGPPYRVALRAGTHSLTADEPTAGGGADAGPSPFGFVMTGLAACTAMTLRMYAERKGWEIASLEVAVSYDVDDEGNASVDRTITFDDGVDPEHKARLGEIAEKTPVTRAVRNGTPITTVIRP